jgi:hypothetical protein
MGEYWFQNKMVSKVFRNQEWANNSFQSTSASYFYHMQIKFTTKEESNKLRQKEFLALTGGERFMRFIDLCEAMSVFPTKARNKNKGNFVIKLYKESTSQEQ